MKCDSFQEDLWPLKMFCPALIFLIFLFSLLMSVLKSNKLYCSHHSASKAPSMHMHVLVFCLFLCCGFVVDLSSHEYKCFGILICTVNSTPSSAQQTSLCGSTCYDPSKHRCCEKTQTSSAGMRLAVFDVQPSIVA